MTTISPLLVPPFRSLIPRLGKFLRLSISDQELETPWRAEVLSREALSELALNLADWHKGTFGASRSKRLLKSYKANKEILKRVYQSLAEAAQRGETLTAGAEWMLDNYHVVERHIAAIKKYLPWGFYRTLPKFTEGELKGFPRIYHLITDCP